MLRKSRKIVALGVTLALAVSGIAVATADQNDARVVGKVAPKKLDKKKFKPVNLTLGVINSRDWVTGVQANPITELIEISKNVRIKLGKRPVCKPDFDTGVPPKVARQACPKKSFLGSGRAEVVGPGIAPQCGADIFNPPCVVAKPVVTVFHGPRKNHVLLVTFDSNIPSPVIEGRIVRAKSKGFGQALHVDAPETAALLITKFQATIKRSTKVALARCKPKRIRFKRTVTYKDDTRESVSTAQKCSVKKKKKRR